jgi:cytochrome c oxidase subunit 4
MAHHSVTEEHQQLDHGDGSVHVHIGSMQFYVGIFAALVLLTIITVKVSYYDFGPLNIIVAILIASAKASLVAVFFMHLRHDSLFNTITFIASFLFLALFILLTYDDIGRRGRLDPDYGGTVLPQTGQAAPGGLPATTATADEAAGEAPPGAEHKSEGGEKK